MYSSTFTAGFLVPTGCQPINTEHALRLYIRFRFESLN